MSHFEKNLSEVHRKITAACCRVGRDISSVQLIAVSKTFPVELILEVYQMGQLVFGESRLQEAIPKIESSPASLCWHFIGGVQRNKVRKLLQNFQMIHAIDSLRLASYVDEISNELGISPQVFLQVNVGGEESKGGFEPNRLRGDMEALLKLKQLEIVGLMCIPPAGVSSESARPWFSSLRQLRDVLEVEFGKTLPSLSMGMSGDYEIAIEEGATHVRVGSAIFGNRAYRVDGELG